MEMAKACGGAPASCCLLCYVAPLAGKRPGCAARAATVDAAAQAGAQTPASSEPPPSWMRRLLWLALPAFASVLLLATTNHVCQDMSAVPFLWVVPLSLYLLSFIIAFDHERWYRRLPYGLAALIAIYLTAGMYNPDLWGGGWLGYVHGWIWGTPPSPWRPEVSYEVDLVCEFTALLRCACSVTANWFGCARAALSDELLSDDFGGRSVRGPVGEPDRTPTVQHVCGMENRFGGRFRAGRHHSLRAGRIDRLRPGWLERAAQATAESAGALRAGGLLAACLALFETVLLLRNDRLSRGSMVEQVRNFYGVLSVIDFPGRTRRECASLTTASSRMECNTWIQRCVRSPRRITRIKVASVRRLSTISMNPRDEAPLRVGVVGLGAGTLATYLYLPGHSIRFYEINPEVLRLAESRFTYLADARQRGVTVEIAFGDARLSLERELKQGSQDFDVLVLDAFSSDSIPIHLLTREAFGICLPHLAPGGARRYTSRTVTWNWPRWFTGWPNTSSSVPFGSSLPIRIMEVG